MSNDWHQCKVNIFSYPQSGSVLYVSGYVRTIGVFISLLSVPFDTTDAMNAVFSFPLT